MVKINNKDELSNVKQEKEIEIERNRNFQGQLVIEDYLELEKLYLQDVKKVDKVVLKNLTQLQECTIWNCDTNDLVIENCPQIKKLNIRQNNLTDLEFLKDLENLEELEIDGNPKIDSVEYLPGNWENFSYKNNRLTEVLKFYRNNWKECKEDTQEIFELSTNQGFQRLIEKVWDLRRKREELKKEISNLSHSHGTASQQISTKELVLNLGQEFKEKEEKINYLEFQVWELTELSKKQKDKIQTYLDNFGSEKELLRILIKSYLEFTKFKNQEIDSPDYDEKYSKYEEQYKDLEKQLWTKLTKEKKSEARRILVDCEKLVAQELELETKLDKKGSLIDKQKKNPALEKSSEEKEKVERQEETHKKQIQQKRKMSYDTLEKKWFETQGQLVTLKEENEKKHEIIKEVALTPKTQNIIAITYHINYSQVLANQELTKLKQNYQSLESINELASDPQKLKKVILFLATKQIFATTRKKTIKILIEIYEKADESGKKYEKLTTACDYMNTAGDIVSSFPPASIALKLLGKGIPVITNLLKDNSLANQAKKFEGYLLEDEKSLVLLQETYQSLNNSLQGEKNKISSVLTELFKLGQNSFSQYGVFVVSEIPKENTNLNAESMKKAIEALDKHLAKFTQELQQEASQNAEMMEEFFMGEDGEVLQTEITELLEKLVGRENNNESKIVEEPQSYLIEDSNEANATVQYQSVKIASTNNEEEIELKVLVPQQLEQKARVEVAPKCCCNCNLL